jgi:elongation factor G
MDELRLEEVCSAICRDKGEVFAIQPTVILLETLRQSAEGEGKYIRQTGGSGNYGHCKIRLSPSETGSGYEFINDIKNGAIPQEFIEPIDMGIRDAMDGGILAGCPIVDVTVALYDGSYHDVDSNPMAFQIAGSMAFKEAARKASPVLLEPVMAVEAVIAEAQYWELLQDINARHGRIEAVEWGNNSGAFKALVPLRETLRSSARGRLEYPMRFARYEPVLNPHGEFGGDVLGVGVRNPQRPNLNSGRAEAELYFELE